MSEARVTWDTHGRPHWRHDCTNGSVEIQLPLCPDRWRVVEPGRSISPSLHCQQCGTHGWWIGGRWLGVDVLRQEITERRADPEFAARLARTRERHRALTHPRTEEGL